MRPSDPSRPPVEWTSIVRTHGLLALLLGTALLYASFLAWSPIYLNNDEAAFAVQAHAIASTGRDMNGRLLPLYFNMLPGVWYQPVIVYWMALFFQVLPVTEWAVRCGSIALAVIDIALVVAVARRVFGSARLALVSGGMLALTPAHFIHGRLACDYLYPVPFLLTSLFFLSVFIERRKPWHLFACGLALGIGFYSYIASVVMMPVYAVLTMATIATIEPKPLRPCLMLVAGFLVAMVPLALWMPSHTDLLYATAARYQMRPRLQLGVWEYLQQQAVVYLRFFDPVHLFLRDRGAVTSSTDRSGVFAVSMAVLIPLGIYRLATGGRPPLWRLLVAGFFVAPFAASFVNEPYTTDRALTMLPFGAMLGAYGLNGLWPARSKASHAAAAVLALAIVVQFAYFYTDYLTGYRTRSAFWFNGNNRAALEEIIAANPAARPRPVYLADNIPFIGFYWKLYLVKHHREDLLMQTVYFDERVDLGSVPSDSFILTNAGDRVERALLASGSFQETALIVEPDGTPTFARFQKR